MSLKEKLKTINKNIGNFAGQHNVKLIAVSKYASDEQVIEAYSEGIRIFGESYVVSALDRINRISNNFNNDVEWHLVGTLQKNKVKKAVGNFRLIQSVNSLDLLKSIDERSALLDIRQAVLIQINILQEGINKLNVNIKGLKKGIYTLELKTTTKTSVLNLQID